MKRKKIFKGLRQAGLGLILSGMLAGPSFAADVYLVARQFAATMPGNVEVPMWGFAEDADSDFTTIDAEVPTVPGPMITVTPGDTTLRIHVRNELGVPVSIVIPGAHAPLTPVKFADAQGRQRVQSFTHETAPGAVGTYEWLNFEPGSYIYQSGTHPAVQVQMGLYGGVKKTDTLTAAYANVPFDKEVSLFYSEIDPALHNAVASGAYGTPAFPGANSYSPKYFLVNGKPYQGQPPISAGNVNEKILVRLYNAGLESHVPLFQGLHVKVVAEDGNPYNYAPRQYTVHLGPGKTKDVILNAASEGVYPVYDRRLFLSNSQNSPGGMLSYLSISSQASAPLAANDNYAAAEDMALTVLTPGVLGNDVSGSPNALTAVLVENVKNGTLSLDSSGSFIYTPSADFSGNDFFTYKAFDGAMESNVASAVIAVSPVNDAPVASNDAVTTDQDTAVMVSVLNNDTDADADQLVVASFSNGANGAVTAHMDHLVYTPNPGFWGVDTFAYSATDGTVTSNIATVTVTVNPTVNTAPVAADDFATTRKNTSVTIDLAANDTDAEGNMAPGTVAIATPPTRGGTVVANANGTVTYTPRWNFRGTDTFTYTVQDSLGAVSNTATVKVNVTK